MSISPAVTTVTSASPTDWASEATALFKLYAIPFLWQVLGALLVWIVGGMLIGVACRMVNSAMNARNLDRTITSYVVSALGILLRIVLIVGVLGMFGVESTSFAALLAAAGVAIGMAWAGLLANFAAGVFLVVLRPFKVGDIITGGGGFHGDAAALDGDLHVFLGHPRQVEPDGVSPLGLGHVQRGAAGGRGFGAAVGVVALAGGWFFRTELLWLIGPAYHGLEFELVLFLGFQVFAFITTIVSTPIQSRGWVRHSWIRPVMVFGSQAVAACFLDLTSVSGAIPAPPLGSGRSPAREAETPWASAWRSPSQTARCQASAECMSTCRRSRRRCAAPCSAGLSSRCRA